MYENIFSVFSLPFILDLEGLIAASNKNANGSSIRFLKTASAASFNLGSNNRPVLGGILHYFKKSTVYLIERENCDIAIRYIQHCSATSFEEAEYRIRYYIGSEFWNKLNCLNRKLFKNCCIAEGKMKNLMTYVHYTSVLFYSIL